MTECCAFYRGKVYLSTYGGQLRHIGNSSELVLTPVRDTLQPLASDTVSNCCGFVDCGLSLKFSCASKENLALALSGSVSIDPVTQEITVSAGTSCREFMTLVFEGENAFGGKVSVTVDRLELFPIDTMNIIGLSEAETFAMSGRIVPVSTSWFKIKMSVEENC